MCMAYMYKKDSSEIILIRYYNVLFYLIFRVGLDEYKRNILVNQINCGKEMRMKDIYGWCQNQSIPVRNKFFYRKDFSIMANLWNLYSYFKFKNEVKKSKVIYN